MAGQELALLEQDPVVVGWREKAKTFKAEALALVIDSDEMDAIATSMMGIGAAIGRAAEAKRVGLVKPHNDEVSGINAFFKRELLPFTDSRPILEERSLAWRRKKAALKAEADAQAERERLRAAALEQEALKAERAGETTVAAQLFDQAVVAETTAKMAAVTAANPIVNHVVTPMGASTVQKRWTFRVLDLAQVPREYLELDQVGVNAAIRNGARDIPGLEIFQAEKLAVSG